ncbi:hypothetical protein AB0A77_02005 [Streptomyces varsoviensis]|uniref:hypothetical protein n=1 Tax=Streptomyces varsoviensis TaxID=67373 RepID=UPI0033D1A88F
MAFYLVSRTDRHDWDEYNAVVVRAGSTATAMKIATHGDFSGFRPDGSNLKVELLDARGPAGLVLASFNAG